MFRGIHFLQHILLRTHGRVNSSPLRTYKQETIQLSKAGNAHTTALHFPPESANPYFAPVPATYRPLNGTLDDQTSQRIDFPGKLTDRITGDFLSSRTLADTFQQITLSERPPPALDKHRISHSQHLFLAESFTKSAYTGVLSVPPLPLIPVHTYQGHTNALDNSFIYTSSYNCH